MKKQREYNCGNYKCGLKDKAKAIAFEEPELKEDFIEKIKQIERQPSIRIKDFRKRYSLN